MVASERRFPIIRPRTVPSFNPLHCGAVVSSDPARDREGDGGARVSIPFIAGQWSLPKGRIRRAGARRVSIPFIAGQWSLQFDKRFDRRLPSGFNPLHCGAVVSSNQSATKQTCFQFGFNPLHCGAVVSSDAYLKALGLYPLCFNPLHCGAVVSSVLLWLAVAQCSSCFNPLHCGAVVSSMETYRVWVGKRTLFQSPSLRGSGLFKAVPTLDAPPGSCFNPLHCGAVVASDPV